MGLENINDPIVRAYYAGRCSSDNESIALQDKTITKNGEYRADDGYDGLGTVTVDVDDGSELIAELEAWKSENEFYAETTKGRIAANKAEYLFAGCSNLTAVPLFDTSKVTNMSGMFSECTSLTTVPLFDTSKVTNMSSMFSECTSLTTVPLFDTSNVTFMNSLFFGCTSLTTVPLFDIRKVTGMSGILSGCKALTDCYLRNIKTALQVGSGTSYGHLLTVDSLVHLIYELRDTGSVKKLTVGSANLEKLANVYVRTIDITDEMRAEDDLVDEKLPFEVCESTDEGAMLISDYVTNKNWTLA